MRILAIVFWGSSAVMALLVWVILFSISETPFRVGMVIATSAGAVLFALWFRRYHLEKAQAEAKAADPTLFGEILRKEDLPK